MAKRAAVKPIKLSPEQIGVVEAAVFARVLPLVPEPFYLLAVSFEKETAYWYLRIYIEGRDCRVSLNDCEAVSRLIDPALENLPELDDLSYSLEVSSPGVFRPLKTQREYAFYQGQPVKVQALPKSKAPFTPVEGLLVDFDESTQRLRLNVEGRPEPVEVAINGELGVYLNPELKLPEDEASQASQEL